MKTTHTHGPWSVNDNNSLDIMHDGYEVARAVIGRAATEEEEALANARLIAAAPSLIDTLQLCHDMALVFGRVTSVRELERGLSMIRNECEAAIRSATVEQAAEHVLEPHRNP